MTNHRQLILKQRLASQKVSLKKALGGLMKARKVKQDQFGTELIDEEK